MIAINNITLDAVLRNNQEFGHNILFQNGISKKDFEKSNHFMSEVSKIALKNLEKISFRVRHKYGELGFIKKGSRFDDTKGYFHYNPVAHKLILESLENFDNITGTKINNLLTSLEKKYAQSENLVKDFLSIIETKIPNIKNEFINSDGEMICFYRLLYYPFNNLDETKLNNKPFASMHTDSGALTIAHYESIPELKLFPGIKYVSEPKLSSGISVDYSEGVSKVFFGRSFSGKTSLKKEEEFTKKYLSGNSLVPKNMINSFLPAPHLVLKNQKNLSKDRFAHVFFMWPWHEFKANNHQELYEIAKK